MSGDYAHTALKGQMKQLSGFMAIEGIPALNELITLYRSFCDPSDHGVQLIHQMVYDNIPALLDDHGERITVTNELWAIVRFFRLHLGMAVATSPFEASEWYMNPGEGVRKKNYCVEADFASELYMQLKVRSTPTLHNTAADTEQLWENMSMSSTPALVDELQALMAMVNGLVAQQGEYMTLLKEEVSRRELDLVRLYLHEHPQVPIPQRLKNEISVARGTDGPAGPI